MDPSRTLIDDVDGQFDPATKTSVASRLSWKQRYLHGWRFGILSGLVLTTLVLLLNVSVLAKFHYIAQKDSSIAQNSLFQGSCDRARQLNIGMHVILNVFSTVLLGASNYAMQCLIAPTRSEIDVAHRQKYWLDIGVPSFRNIRFVSRKRLLLWVLLIISSLPLHLLYNSAVYASIASNDYAVIFTDENTVNKTDLITPSSDTHLLAATVTQVNREFRAGNLSTLNVEECIAAYAIPVQSKYGNVVVVQEHHSQPKDKALAYRMIDVTQRGARSNPAFWLCDGLTTIPFGTDVPLCLSTTGAIDVLQWKPNRGIRAKYCLAEKPAERWRVQFSPQIAYTVIACNVVKVVVLLLTFLSVTENPIITMGDAVASFLKQEDTTTAGLCLLSKTSIALWSKTFLPMAFHAHLVKWRHSASRRRWILSMILYAIVIFLCFFFFIYGLLGNQSASPSSLFSLGLGSVTPEVFIAGEGWRLPSYGPRGLISNVLIANFPQLILSAVYYTYNGLFTCFNLAREWDQYSTHKKGLRLSVYSQGSQRSTYFLQLPYRYGIFLMLFSLTLHWLCSQSIFLVSMEIDTIRNQANFDSVDWIAFNYSLSESKSHYEQYFGGDKELYTCGYSPKALLFTIIIGLFMIIFAYGMGQKKLKGVIPLASTCSASMSAMCHLPEMEDGEDAILLPLQWGASQNMAEVYGPENSEIGHCSFSSQAVFEPMHGQMYAGVESSFAEL